MTPDILSTSEPLFLSSNFPPALRRRVQETIGWYNDEHGAGQRPRTPYASPRVLLSDITGDADREQVVSEVFQKRNARLGRKDIPLEGIHLGEGPVGGRLVIFDPTLSVNDGASEKASRGYFDICDEPGWDTWVDYRIERDRSYLIAWVPPQDVVHVDLGIRVNPVESVRWLADARDTQLFAALQSGLPK